MQHFNELCTPLAAGVIVIVMHLCIESAIVFNECALGDRVYCISTKAVMKEAHYELASTCLDDDHQSSMTFHAGLESKGQES
jgi:hypothetical protein